MFFEKQEEYDNAQDAMNAYEYKAKFGFLDQLKNSVRTDEEYAKYKGFID